MDDILKNDISDSISSTHFSQYGRSFQEKIVQSLLVDKSWATQMVEVMLPSYFSLEYLSYLTTKYFEYFSRYKDFPTLQLLISIVREDLRASESSSPLSEEVIDFLQRSRMFKDVGDLQYVKEKTLDFCKRQAMKAALERAVDLISSERYDSVVQIVKDAVSVGIPTSPGHDLFNDIDARFEENRRNPCSTGIPQLDDKDVLNGGLEKGELGIVVSNTGVGKCCGGDTWIRIKYQPYIIDGQIVRPWSKVVKDSKEFFARDVGVLSKKLVTRRVQLKEFFEEFGITTDEKCEIPCDFIVGVYTPERHMRIEGFRVTELLPEVEIELDDGRRLIATHDHYLMTRIGWKKIKDLQMGEEVLTDGMFSALKRREETNKMSRLFDLQVEDVHCYFTNEILSHNSHFLVHLGACALRQKKNVIHYTFELSEKSVGFRYDSHLCDIPCNDVRNLKNLVKKKYDDLKNNIGRIIIKEYPTCSASVITLRAHLEKLSLRCFQPDLIIVDYADIMKSTRQYDSMRHELKLIYEELRNLAGELKVPIWSASQAHRDSANLEIVGLENMSEAYAKAMTADIVLSLQRKPLEKSTGLGRLFIAKNRAGKDGIVFPIRLDTSRSVIQVLNEQDVKSLSQTLEEDENMWKKKLREKHEEMMIEKGE